MMHRPPKKTEKLEVRLPAETKQAFLARCRAENRSASAAVRAFIEGHLARPLTPRELPMILRSPSTYAGAAAIVAVGVITLSAQPTLAEPDFTAIFKSLDADGNGRLSPAEFNRSTGSPAAPDTPNAGRASLSAGFAEMDTNRDQAVSLAEFVAFNRAAIVRRFLALDADSDGRITLAELRKADAPLSEAGSGFAISGPPERFFARFDTDKDGVLTEAEFAGPP